MYTVTLTLKLATRFLHAEHCLVLTIIYAKTFEIASCRKKLWAEHINVSLKSTSFSATVTLTFELAARFLHKSHRFVMINIYFLFIILKISYLEIKKKTAVPLWLPPVL